MTAPRLVLDLQGCQDVANGDRGIGRYVSGLAAALQRRPGAVAAMLLNPQLPFPGHLDSEILDSPLLQWNTAAACAAAAAAGPVAYHLLSPFETGSPGPVAVPAHALGESTPLVVTLHDLMPLRSPDELLPDPVVRRRYMQRVELVRSADLVLCNSEYTRRDAMATLGLAGERCVAVGGASDPRFRPARAGDDPHTAVRTTLPAVHRGIVLLVGGGVARKNTERLISAYARLPRELRARHQLVVVCDLHPAVAQLWRARISAEGLATGEVVLTGFLDDAVLLALYQAASLVVMPSLEEGYGLPVAEAVACGAPVITSHAAALPEILDLPESTFDPLDVPAMAAALQRGLSDDGFRERLRDAGRRAAPRHTWDAVADRTLAALAMLDRAHRSAPGAGQRGTRRMRLALVGPMPPVLSGVADYNGRVVAALAERCDLDVLIPPRMAHPAHGTVPRWLPSLALGRSVDPAGYDAVVYTFGNSEHHVTTYDLLHRFPGILWLHDVRLGGFHLNYADERADDPAQWMREQLRDAYGPRLGRLDAVDNLFDREWQHRTGIYLTRLLVRASRAVMVNSAFAEQLLRLDQGPDWSPRPIIRLPFAAAPAPQASRPARESDPPLIVSAGSVDSIKAPERIIDALGAIAAETPARLVFVGFIHPVYRSELEQRAAALGVAERVAFTGPTDAATWWEWLGRATLAVQLRRLTNGESSAAIGDAQSSGTPVITNVLDAPMEHPEDTVLWLADLSPGTLEAAMLRLLRDRGEWQRRSAAGIAHARARSFEHLADVLLARLDDVLCGRPVAS
jgi:glycosyltransferase involved in cell wall biosynthesis